MFISFSVLTGCCEFLKCDVRDKKKLIVSKTTKNDHILKSHSPLFIFLSHTLHTPLSLFLTLSVVRRGGPLLSYVWFARVMELDSEALEKQQQQDGHTVQSLPATNQTTSSSNFPRSTRWHFYVKTVLKTLPNRSNFVRSFWLITN